MENKRYSVEWGVGEETAMLGNLLSWAKQHLQQVKRKAIEEVPDDIALCEFDCRKTQCRYDEWATCERRLRSEKEKQDYESKLTEPTSRG